jgi:cupin fold WbuC family metalloprotein
MARTRINPYATIAGHDRWAVVDRNLVAEKAVDAAANPRRRDIHVLHDGDPDPLQRMVNAVQPGTYVQPHRHLHPPTAETFVVLTGSAGFVLLDDDDPADLDRAARVLLDRERGAYAVDIRPGVWHGLVCLAPDTVLLEVKNGPYAPHSDKDFAPWAPAPDSPQAVAFVQDLERRFARPLRD